MSFVVMYLIFGVIVICEIVLNKHKKMCLWDNKDYYYYIIIIINFQKFNDSVLDQNKLCSFKVSLKRSRTCMLIDNKKYIGEYITLAFGEGIELVT